MTHAMHTHMKRIQLPLLYAARQNYRTKYADRALRHTATLQQQQILTSIHPASHHIIAASAHHNIRVCLIYVCL